MKTTLMRLGLLYGLAAIVLTVAAPAAAADAPGPTNYNTEIVALEPASQAFRVEMIGGDAFIVLEQVEAVEITVLGYQSEPYLRFAPDGTVFENQRSPAVWQNRERLPTGEEELPSFVDASARPQWLEVASNGRYAWHDHRTHWMNDVPPVNKGPGDLILEWAVPVEVEGERVLIMVESYWIEAPSMLPAIAGAAVGLGAALVGLRSNRTARSLIGLLVGGAATLIGAISFRSVPIETQPSRLLWLLPVVAVAASVAVLLIRNRLATTVYLDGLAATAGGTLVVWAIQRFGVLQKALIPTSAPYALDRMVVAMTIVVGVALALHGLYGLIKPQKLAPALS